jgi:hypothetical protein
LPRSRFDSAVEAEFAYALVDAASAVATFIVDALP